MSVDYSAYDEFLTEANTDDRIGDHDAKVTEVTNDTWPSGDARCKVRFDLLTANGTADITFSDLPTPEVILAEKDSWDRGKKWGIAKSIELRRQLKEEYGIEEIDGIKEGMTFRVKTVKTRVDPVTQKGGFIRIKEFLPKSGLTGAEASAPF